MKDKVQSLIQKFEDLDRQIAASANDGGVLTSLARERNTAATSSAALVWPSSPSASDGNNSNVSTRQGFYRASWHCRSASYNA